jgi:hypothetical protein
MRKFFTIAAMALAVMCGAGTAEAQVRFKPVLDPQVMVPRTLKAPRLQRPVKPNMILLPPSAALARALAANPGAKPLGVKLRGQTYVVRLKQGGTITQLGVNPMTGAVTPLP